MKWSIHLLHSIFKRPYDRTILFQQQPPQSIDRQIQSNQNHNNNDNNNNNHVDDRSNIYNQTKRDQENLFDLKEGNQLFEMPFAATSSMFQMMAGNSLE